MVSAVKERYLWEIYSNVIEEGHARVSQLAKALQVSVSSASRMAKKLNDENLIEFKRYGMITLTENGMELGKRLSTNHEILIRFFQAIGVDEEKIEEEVNKIEFHIGSEVLRKINQFFLERGM